MTSEQETFNKQLKARHKQEQMDKRRLEKDLEDIYKNPEDEIFEKYANDPQLAGHDYYKKKFKTAIHEAYEAGADYERVSDEWINKFEQKIKSQTAKSIFAEFDGIVTSQTICDDDCGCVFDSELRDNLNYQKLKAKYLKPEGKI